MLNINEEPILLMGDFNASDNSKVIDIIRVKLTDTMKDAKIMHKGPVGTFNNFGTIKILRELTTYFQRIFKRFRMSI